MFPASKHLRAQSAQRANLKKKEQMQLIFTGLSNDGSVFMKKYGSFPFC